MFTSLYRVLFLSLVFLITTLGAHVYRPGYDAVMITGDYIQIALPVIGAGASLIIKDFEGTLEFVESFGTTMAAVYILKPMVNEQRPNGGNYSFPSGHTAAAVAGAAFIQMRYGWAYGAPAYVLAAYVGFSRVYCCKHWIGDVIGGAAIGLAANVLFTRPYKHTCHVQAFFQNDRKGISIDKDF